MLHKTSTLKSTLLIMTGQNTIEKGSFYDKIKELKQIISTILP
jgi:hypothetical protein